MLSLALKLLAKYTSDWFPGSMQEVNYEDGGTWTVSYIHFSVDKVRGGKKRWSSPVGRLAEECQMSETLLERRA